MGFCLFDLGLKCVDVFNREVCNVHLLHEKELFGSWPMLGGLRVFNLIQFGFAAVLKYSTVPSTLFLHTSPIKTNSFYQQKRFTLDRY